MAVLLVIGLVAWNWDWNGFLWMRRAAPSVCYQAWGQVLGIYLLSMSLGQTIVLIIHEILRPIFRIPPGNRSAAAMVGVAECVLYPTSLLIGHPGFIGIWLAMKVAGAWSGWSDKETGRSYVQRFLFGTALSLFLGLVAYGLLKGIAIRY